VFPRSRFGSRTGSSAVAVADDTSVRFVRGRPSRDGRPAILSYGDEPLDARRTLAGALKSLGGSGSKDGATVLLPGEYQVHVIEAPDVPEDEVKLAAKWKLKDIIGFPAEEASVDVIKIPGPEGVSARARSMLAVVARRALLKERVARFDDARFELSFVDVPEIAQRNLASLYESERPGVAWLFIDDAGGLLTISYAGELYLARRIDTRYADIESAGGVLREDLFSRIVLDLQRTIDSFERQFSFVPITRLVVGPEPEDTGLVAYLAAHLTVRVEEASLEKFIDFPMAAPDRREQWRLFHLIGCALRNEAPVP